MKTFIAYHRVSTARQGDSGLGLSSQEAAIKRYVEQENGEIIQSYTEIQSGGCKDVIRVDQNISIQSLLRKRPILQKVIEEAKKTGATIIVKESSRLSRFSLLIDFLISTGVNFTCADSPRDSEMIIKLKTIIAEDELKKISERTRRALDEKRKKGEPMGSQIRIQAEQSGIQVSEKGLRQGFKIGHIVKSDFHRKDLIERNEKMMGLVRALRESKTSWYEVVKRVNELGYKTREGKEFNAPLLCRYYKKYFVPVICLAFVVKHALDYFY